MKPLLSLLGCLLCMALATADEARAQAPPAEMKVFQHWIGKWDVTMTTKPNENNPKEVKTTGTATAEWILDGRFLQQTSMVNATADTPALKMVTILTWDEQKKAYRSWSYFSNGHTSEMEGTWNEQTKTLTTVGRDAASGATTTIKGSFPEDGVEVWSVIVKDRDGKVRHDSTGKNTRKKP